MAPYGKMKNVENVNELACGEGGRVHGAKCLAVLVSGYATVA